MSTSPTLTLTPTPNFATTSNVLSEQLLSHSDYPKVHFWFRRDWVNRKKEKLGITKVNESSTTGDKGRGPMGVNVTLRYVEDEHGTVIDGFRGSEMRKFARSIWSQLARAGKAPRSWGKAELDVAAHYRREMRRRFPELGLCEYDWKADQLATDNYPNWASTHLPEALVKREFSDMSSMQAKRRKDSVGHISKKARTGSVLSVSIDDNSTHPSNNTLNLAPGLPPINSTTSASVPAAVPTITIPTVTHATSMPVVILPHTIPAMIPTTTVPTAPTITPATIPTIPISDGNNNMVSPVSRILEEENVPADPTTTLIVTTEEAPASIITDTPPSINPIATDGNGAATLTIDSASIPRKTVPRVRISSTLLIICLALLYRSSIPCHWSHFQRLSQLIMSIVSSQYQSIPSLSQLTLPLPLWELVLAILEVSIDLYTFESPDS